MPKTAQPSPDNSARSVSNLGKAYVSVDPVILEAGRNTIGEWLDEPDLRA